MIRVIIKRQVKDIEKIPVLLRELRMKAIGFPGYVSGETLVGADNPSLVTVISNWQSLADWKSFEVSEQRNTILKRIEPFQLGPTIIDSYELLSTEELEYLENPSDWLIAKEHPSFDG